MDTVKLKKIWNKKYQAVPAQVKKISEVKSAVTAFNTNIDAVIKISGTKFANLIAAQKLTLNELEDIKKTKILSPDDVLKGLFKCFKNGIAEEWITEKKSVYDWLNTNIGYDRLQIGGQGGIVANALATAGVQNVYVHANSLPQLQAAQFARLDNLLSFDEKGQALPAYQINRTEDIPLIHWIMEFDRGEILELEGHKFRCPKSNRFIATYDPLNLKLITDQNFMTHVQTYPADFVILSGFHALTANNGGVQLLDEIAVKIKNWRQKCPSSIFHLEVASTQDEVIRKTIIDKIAPLMDSMGINERETIDVLEVIGEKDFAQKCSRKTTADNLFSALVKIKEKTAVPRIQLHMFGLYITLQNRNFKLTPQQNLNGMMTAATIAAAKAGTGNIENMLWAHGNEVSDVGLIEAESLTTCTGLSDLAATGIGHYRHWDLIVVPTILIEKPLTLVGMGDTISSLSLVAAR